VKDDCGEAKTLHILGVNPTLKIKNKNNVYLPLCGSVLIIPVH